MNIKFLSSIPAIPGALIVLLAFFLPWVTFSMTCSVLSGLDSMMSGVTADMEAEGFEVETSTSSASPSDLEVNASGFDLATGRAYQEVEDWSIENGASPEEITSDALEEQEQQDDFGATSDVGNELTDSLEELDIESGLEADPILWGIVIIGVMVLALAGVRFFDTGLYPALWTGVTYIVLSVIGLGIYILKYIDLQNNLGSPVSNFNEAIEDSPELGLLTTGSGFSVESLTEIITFSYQFGWYLTLIGFILIFIGGALAFMESDDEAQPVSISAGTTAAPQWGGTAPLSDDLSNAPGSGQSSGEQSGKLPWE